jgi:hypothetical protein
MGTFVDSTGILMDILIKTLTAKINLVLGYVFHGKSIMASLDLSKDWKH